MISVAGLVLIWRNASAAEQETMRHYAEPLRGIGGIGDPASDQASRRHKGTVIRLGLAALLLVVGLGSLLSAHASIVLLRPLGGMILLIAAVVLFLCPWWLRIARDLVMERQARAVAEERADMAARVHDSVLQTLALIQRRSDDPQQVIQLARAQERELRSWLFEGRAPGDMAEEGMTLAAGIRLIQQEVEAKHGVAVEPVIVGDCEYDDDIGALLAAAKEATVNAAKWSGAAVISLYAEVQPGEVSLVIRDRGRGFDPEAVPADRKGVAESIRGRMARRGGSATVHSVPGEGTKVSLSMPRSAARPQPVRT